MGDLMSRRLTCFIPIVVIALWAAVAEGRPVEVARDASVAEEITYVEGWIKSHPKDTAGYRVLARIHALAWAYGEKIPLLERVGDDGLPRFAEDSTVLVSRIGPREGVWFTKVVPAGERQERDVTPEEAKHLAGSIAAYRKAIELNASDGLSELGLGWMLAEQGKYARELPADYFRVPAPSDDEKAAWDQAIAKLSDDSYEVREAASKTLLAAMPGCIVKLQTFRPTGEEAEARINGVLQGYFELEALEHYRKAYALQAEVDLKTEPTYQVDSQVSAKAGVLILTMLARHPEAARKGEAKAIETVLDVLEKKWQQLMMTPT